jgi:hypothetical protein
MTSSSSWVVNGPGGAAIATAIAGGDREASLKEVAKPHCRYGFSETHGPQRSVILSQPLGSSHPKPH